MIFGSFNRGLVFSSIDDAEKIVPKLRSFGFFEEEFFWYLSLEREEVDQMLKDPSWKRFPTELFNTYFHEPSGNYMDRMGEGPASWFQNKAHFQYYVKFIERMEAMT